MERAWIDIDLSAIAANLRALRAHIGPKPEIRAVIKANAYGHGALAVARTLSAEGAEGFAVATADEARAIRAGGIGAPLMVLGPVPDGDWRELLGLGITPLILDRESARALAYAARNRSRRGLPPVRAHLKVDTGMRRYGFEPSEAASMLSELAELPGLEIEGLATHLACGEDPERSAEQVKIFQSLRGDLKRRRLLPPRFHLANSAGTILRDASRDDIVRPGLSLFGIDPVGLFRRAGLSLQPALAVKARLALIRDVPANSTIGYGGTYRTSRPTRLGLVSIGYGDGWPWIDSNSGAVLIAGQRCPMLGTVMMDAIAVDLSDLPEAAIVRDSEVTLIGRQGLSELRAEDISARHRSLAYELPCRLGARLPRRFREVSVTPAFASSAA